MFENLVYTNLVEAKKLVGVSYLGNVAHSAKLLHSLSNGTATYCLYLAPSDLSGYNVCPNGKYCKDFCLFTSGHNLMDIRKQMASNNDMDLSIITSKITRSRIIKTKLFFENRTFFMRWLIDEIRIAKLTAEVNGYDFSVRLNGTSDIKVTDFEFNGECILDIFKDVQFYDYTKVYPYLALTKKFSNYDITYSYNGYNWSLCEQALKSGYRVSVVFEKVRAKKGKLVREQQILPKTFKGYKVINGDNSDIRYVEPSGVIVGLEFKQTAQAIKDGKNITPDTQFIVKRNNTDCYWGK